jgi:hypothetical protein
METILWKIVSEIKDLKTLFWYSFIHILEQSFTVNQNIFLSIVCFYALILWKYFLIVYT